MNSIFFLLFLEYIKTVIYLEPGKKYKKKYSFNQPYIIKSKSKMEKARNQLDEVTGLMRGNMTKIMEREGKLNDLEIRADKLQTDSEVFQVTF